MHDQRLAWEQQVTTALAASGISITGLPDGALASAFIEGVTPTQFVEWATTTNGATANNAAPVVAPAATASNRIFAPIQPVPSVTANQPVFATARPVKPAATLVTAGVAIHYVGSIFVGIGDSMGILFGGEAYLLLGGLVAATGLVVTMLGVRRFLTAHDRQHCQAA